MTDQEYISQTRGIALAADILYKANQIDAANMLVRAVMERQEQVRLSNLSMDCPRLSKTVHFVSKVLA